MGTIYLHMGLHKTATSAFQAFCHENLELLRNAGYTYPIFSCASVNKPKISNHSIPVYSCFSSDSNKYHINIRWGVGDVRKVNQAYREQLDHYLLKGGDVILSGEDISLLSEEDFEELLHYLRSIRQFEIKPFIFVRSPYDFHCSMCQQKVKIGSYVDFVKLYSQRPLLEKLHRIFSSDLTVFSYNKAAATEKGVIGTILDFVGVGNRSDFKKDSQNNKGASNEFVRLQNRINRSEPCIVDGRVNSKHFKIADHGSEKFRLSDSEVEAVKGQLLDENSFFKSFLGEEFCDNEIPSVGDQCCEESCDDMLVKLMAPIFQMTNPSIDLLRDFAVQNEAVSFEVARQFMALAHCARPKGPLIKQKLEYYKQKLG